MGKNRKKHLHRFNKKPNYLSNDVETSETGLELAPAIAKKKKEYDNYEKIPAPFKEAKSDKPITWGDVSYTWKVVVVVSCLLFAVGGPIIWWSSGISTDVKNIGNDIHEVKETTKSLLETTIKNTSRLDGVEKTVSILTEQLGNSKNSTPKQSISP